MREVPVSDVALKNVKGQEATVIRKKLSREESKKWWPVVSPGQQSTCPN